MPKRCLLALLALDFRYPGFFQNSVGPSKFPIRIKEDSGRLMKDSERVSVHLVESCTPMFKAAAIDLKDMFPIFAAISTK